MIINRLQTMKKNAYTYCEGSFASYQATKDNWGNPDGWDNEPSKLSQ